jgi:hypothetical protein
MKNIKTVFMAVLVVAAITVGCAKKGTSDDALATNIKAQLYSDPATKPASINVDVKGGVATLSGDVPSSDVELQALKLANGTAGVTRVDDQMKVNTSLAASQAPPDSPAPQIPASAPPPTKAPSNPPPAAPVASTTPAPTTTAAAAPPPPPEPVAPPAPPQPVTYTVPAGEHLSVQMIDSIDSGRNQTGQAFRASLASPVTQKGRVLIPAGAPVTVVLTNVKGAGRIKGSSELALQLTEVQYQGQTYTLSTSTYEAVGKGRGKSSAIRTGIGAAAGALIGGLAGGGKGAGIGAVVGGGGVAGYQLATHGQQIKIPSETVLNFTLQSPLVIEKTRRERNPAP